MTRSRRNGKGSKFLSAMGTGWEIWTDIVNAVLNEDPENADERLRELKGDKDRLQAIAKIVLANAAKSKSAAAIETVTVPHLSAIALVAAVKEETGCSVRDFYEQYDFIRDECGKTYEFVTWAPGRRVSLLEARGHLASLGEARPYIGNVAACLQWIRTKRPTGIIVTIPEVERRFCTKDGRLCVTIFGGDCLELCGCDGGFWEECVFVAFREYLP